MLSDDKILSPDELDSVAGGKGTGKYVNVRLDKLKSQFESACRRKNLSEVMAIAGELQARGYYSWAKETANSYGITCL